MDFATELVRLKDSSNHQPLSRDDLRATLLGVRLQIKGKQAHLRTLVKTNLPALQWFHSHSQALTAAHEQLQVEIQAMRDFKPLRLDILPSKPVAMVKRDEFRGRVVRERLMEAVQKVAVTQDFEMEKVNAQDSTVMMISKKMARLAKILNEAPKELVQEASNTYVRLAHASMKSNLEQLPHFAALFHNDTLHLATIMAALIPEANVTSWVDLGRKTLQFHVRKQTAELQQILTVKGDNVERVAAQALHRIGQIGKVWAPLLPPDVFSEAMRVFEGVVLTWLWAYLSSLDYITDTAIQEAKRLAAAIVRAQDSNNIVDGLGELRAMIRAYVEAMDMSLMQLTNRIRRGQFNGTLSPQHCHALIQALFEDSPSRQACLEEIEEDF